MHWGTEICGIRWQQLNVTSYSSNCKVGNRPKPPQTGETGALAPGLTGVVWGQTRQCGAIYSETCL